jgi:hypothetical protein
MILDISYQEVEDLKLAIYLAMQTLDKGNSIDKETANRLEVFREERLCN